MALTEDDPPERAKLQILLLASAIMVLLADGGAEHGSACSMQLCDACDAMRCEGGLRSTTADQIPSSVSPPWARLSVVLGSGEVPTVSFSLSFGRGR